jgi:hypothetical protein
MPTYAHARDRSTVILNDGRIGTLIFITRASKRAKVRLPNGAHLMVPSSTTRVLVTHLAGAEGWTDCCRVPTDTLAGAWRLTDDLGAVDCRG